MALGTTVLTIVLAISGYVESIGAAGGRRSRPAAIAGIVISFSVVPAVIMLAQPADARAVPPAQARHRRAVDGCRTA